ncbi:hypothetical protein [Roseivivax sp. THAF30]|uniref:hypothetical protein n=1 Tax=Roseivivax sp. THAF30 TaxID=2587852 RepID=UPI0012680A4D|nr:hypothetical protein [Roseivivax sp. THAF30]QFT62209.1 hypothetical protein FIU91_04645 [Roseivivax sp. THAF30]
MPYRPTDFGRFCDPQPYTQLAKVLREQGMALGAARVLEARDRRVLDATFNRRMAAVDGSLAADVEAALALVKRPFDWLFGVMFGYGHRPGRALFAVLGILALNWALYAQVWEAGQMAPTSDVVLTSEAWTRHVALMPDGDLDTSVNTLRAWTDSEAAQDYTTFNAPLYALDLFIPLDALGQEAAWAPSPVRGIWGTLGFATGWLTQLSGWLITAIAAAAVAGIVGRKD